MRLKTLAVAVLGAILLAFLAACSGRVVVNYGTVDFVDDQHGWVTGFDAANKQTVISTTSDGGTSWSIVGTSGLGRAGRIVGPAAFSAATTGVWCVYNEKVLYTADGGVTWQQSATPDLAGHFTAMSFATPTVGWGVSNNGGIFVTTDAGASYVKQRQAKVGGAFIDVVARSETVCCALKDGLRCGVWATMDGGLTWTRHRLPGKAVHPIYCAIDFPSDLVGYAVGGGGKIAKSIDGGVTWVAQTSGTRARLQGVCFTDDLNGYAVGKRGTILHTTDGGTTWAAQTSGTEVMLNSVDFVSAAEGWIVGQAGWAPGQEGVLLHTVDAGTTWAP